MNKEKGKEFVIKKLKECNFFTHDEHPQSIYYFWDSQLIRQRKLLRLAGKNEIVFNPSQNSILLFEEEHQSKYFKFDFNYIYQVLSNQYKFGFHQDIIKLIREILDERKINLTPYVTELSTKKAILYKNHKLKPLNTSWFK